MATHPIAIIFNPSAKSEKALQLLTQLKTLTRDHADLFITQSIGDALPLAQKAAQEGYETIVAAGGDGTLNEVINGIHPYPVRIGILPLGTMNVFAHEMRISSKLHESWQTILEGHTRSIDLPLLNDRRFIQLAGIGFDAEVVQLTTWESKRQLGPLSYILSATQALSHPTPRFTVSTDTLAPTEATLALIGNGAHYGGPFKLFPEADNQDGLLDLCLFTKMSYLDALRYLQAIITGTHTRLPDVRYLKSPQIEIHSTIPIPTEVDGELLGYTPCTLRMDNTKLTIICPS
jgi:YegS/Rv2252/BmrU family lipid kinase